MGRLENFYTSKPWKRFRRALIMERRDASGMLYCEHCGEPITLAYDCIGHHKINLTPSNFTDPMIALNPDNVALVHHHCHNEIHERFGYGNGAQGGRPPRKVFFVWGSPCAGKSTFVESSAGKGDVVLDFDKVVAALTADGVRNDSVLGVAFPMRDAALDAVKVRAGQWAQAWIISADPLATSRARMIDGLGAEEIHVDTPQDVCIERASERGQEAVEYTKRYWSRLT